MLKLITKHQLDFEVRPWRRDPTMREFKVGTCEGLYQSTSTSYQIIAINNSKRGNGHLDDVFEWFESSCKRDKKDLEVIEILNQDFLQHLINRRGFINKTHDSVIKRLDNI